MSFEIDFSQGKTGLWNTEKLYKLLGFALHRVYSNITEFNIIITNTTVNVQFTNFSITYNTEKFNTYNKYCVFDNFTDYNNLVKTIITICKTLYHNSYVLATKVQIDYDFKADTATIIQYCTQDKKLILTILLHTKEKE